MGSFAYDHPNHLVRRENCTPSSVTGVAAGGRFRVAQKSFLKAVHLAVVTASSAGTVWSVRAGGSAIGAWTAGTGTGTHTMTLNYTMTALSTVIDVVSNASVAAVDVIYEYYVMPDATHV